jgi:hypothetical protein
MDTRDTTVRVCGILRCAKVTYRTRTRDTRFGNTAGKPVPVAKPRYNLSIWSSLKDQLSHLLLCHVTIRVTHLLGHGVTGVCYNFDGYSTRLRIPSTMASDVSVGDEPGRWDAVREVLLGTFSDSVPGSSSVDANTAAFARVNASTSASCRSRFRRN